MKYVQKCAKPRTQTMKAPRLYYRQLVFSWGKLCAKAWDEVQWHGMIRPYALARQSEKDKTTKEKSQMINKIHYTKNQIYTKFVRKNKIQKRTDLRAVGENLGQSQFTTESSPYSKLPVQLTPDNSDLQEKLKKV